MDRTSTPGGRFSPYSFFLVIALAGAGTGCSQSDVARRRDAPHLSRSSRGDPKVTRRDFTYSAGIIAALVVGFLLSRLGKRSEFVAPDTGPRLVSYRGGSAGLSAVKEAIINEPSALRSPKAARGVVEELVRARILAGLAVEKGYDRDPQLSQRYAEQLANLYLEKEFEAAERSKAPTDDEVKAFFEAHRAELNRPARIRLGVIVLRAATPDETAGKRATKRGS